MSVSIDAMYDSEEPRITFEPTKTIENVYIIEVENTRIWLNKKQAEHLQIMMTEILFPAYREI